MKILAKKIKNSLGENKSGLFEKEVKPCTSRKECSYFTNLLHEAEKVKFVFNDNCDIDTLLMIFRRKIQSSSFIYKIGKKIYLEHYQCVCQPESNIIEKNENCSCANDSIKKIYETLLEGPVEVELLKSISKGDGMCQHLITLSD